MEIIAIYKFNEESFKTLSKSKMWQNLLTVLSLNVYIVTLKKKNELIKNIYIKNIYMYVYIYIYIYIYIKNRYR